MAGDLLPYFAYPVGAGVVLFAFGRGWKRVDGWQEGRKDVNAADHTLLHQMADVMLDQVDPFTKKVRPGVVSKVDTLQLDVAEILNRVSAK